MKKTSIFLFLLLSMLLMTACGPSLKEYVAMSSNYYSSVNAHNAVSVEIETKGSSHSFSSNVGSSVGAALNLAANVGAVTVSQQQTKRLQSLVKLSDMASLVAQGFDDGFIDTTHMTSVDKNANPDIRIMITLKNHGLWAESMLSKMHFYVEVDLSVIYMPEMKTIYSNGMTMMRDVSTIFTDIADVADRVHVRAPGATPIIVGGATHLLSGAANITAFFQLSDKDIMTALQVMAYDAGNQLANELVHDIYD